MDPPKAHALEDFMNNNEDLPDLLKQDVREILAKHRQDLKGLDEEIRYHEERTKQLKTRRSQVQEDIGRYDGVRSPIRRAHPDILRNMFLHCLPTTRNPVMKSREAPLLLTRICRTWREMAYSSPSLWSQLHITFSDEDLSPYVKDEPINQSIQNTLRLRCSAVEEWLSRSGSCPLSISIRYTTCIWMEFDDRHPVVSDITSRLFWILSCFSSRWRHIELHMPIEVFSHLGRMITGAQLPMLDSVMASFRYQTFDYADYGQVVSYLLQPQSLRKISLSVQGQDLKEDAWRIIHILSPDLHLTNLRSLCSHMKISVLETNHLLRACPNLEYFTALVVSANDDHNHEAFATSFSQGPIFLPHLRFLCIEDIIMPTVKINIYEHIEAPRLEWIDYTKYNGDHTRHYNLGAESGMSIDPAPIATLLQRSPALKKLILQVNDLQTSQLRRIIHYASSITHLVLGPEHFRMEKETIAPVWYMGPRPDTPKWDFGRLFFDDYLGGDTPTPCFVLPNLEVLEISKKVSKNIKDETLRAFILSRLDPSSLNKMIKKLTVDFNRTMSLDVAKDVYAHADRVGANFELHLGYIPPVPIKHTSRPPDFLSPDYGVGPDNRSWELRDIENEVDY